MTDMFRRYWLLLVLAVALIINIVIYWPGKNASSATHGGDRPPLPPEFSEDSTSPEAQARKAQFQAMLEKLPAAQRKSVEDRVEADRTFFASIKNLPETERREKMDAHFRQNPPPPMLAGVPGGPPPNGATPENGGPDGNGPGAHIPPPDVRQSMDRQIANSQRDDATP